MVADANEVNEEVAHASSAPDMTDDDIIPADVIDGLEPDSECIHIETPDEYMLWQATDAEEWCVLEMAPSGSWYPNPRISHREMAEALLGDATEYTVAPLETTVPAGRLAVDE